MVGAAALGLAGAGAPMRPARASGENARVRAIAFDAFPIFDPRPILHLARSLAPGREAFGAAWFERIFAYSWLRTSARQYRDFPTVIADALDYTASQQGLVLAEPDRERLLTAWLRLEPWPDVASAIRHLQGQGIRLAFLSNFTEEMLRANAANAGLESAFEYFSTDLARAYKPDPRAYRLAIDGLGLEKSEIVFCAFAAWDAAGASWFGYPTVWVNRLAQAPENLAAPPAATGEDLSVLRSFVEARVAPVVR